MQVSELLEFETVAPCPNDHLYLIFEYADWHDLPQTNEEALTLIRSHRQMHQRGFSQTDGASGNVTTLVYKGYLATIESPSERVRQR